MVPSELSLVILNYNGAEILRETLSTARAVLPSGAELLLVDNGSVDHSRSVARNAGVVTIVASNQHQFITGLNTAFQQTTRPWVLFAQNDVRFHRGSLCKLVQSVTQDAIYQPLLLNQDGSVNHAGVRYQWPGVGIGNRQFPSTNAPVPIEVFSTACFLMPRRIFNRVGLFDTQFAPAYYEDVDYSLRAQQAGIPRYLLPGVHATHLSTWTFGRVYGAQRCSHFCHFNRRKLVRKHFQGVNQLTRLAGLRIADLCSWGQYQLHGDTYQTSRA